MMIYNAKGENKMKVITFIKRNSKSILCGTVAVLAIIGALTTVLYVLGYRIDIKASARPDWEAVGAIAACLMPIVVVYIERRIKSSVEDANAKLISELSTFKAEYEVRIKEAVNFIEGMIDGLDIKHDG